MQPIAVVFLTNIDKNMESRFASIEYKNFDYYTFYKQNSKK